MSISLKLNPDTDQYFSEQVSAVRSTGSCGNAGEQGRQRDRAVLFSQSLEKTIGFTEESQSVVLLQSRGTWTLCVNK